MRMTFRGFDAEQAACPADITQRFVAGEVKFLSKGFEIQTRKSGHCSNELFQLGRVRVKLFENSLLAMFNFVLSLAVAQCLGQFMPELKKPMFQHDVYSAVIARDLDD